MGKTNTAEMPKQAPAILNLGVTMPRELLDRLDTYRWPNRLTRSAAIQEAVREWLGRKTAPEQGKARKRA